MAIAQNGAVTPASQVQSIATVKKSREVAILDGEGFPLVPEERMPFIDLTKGDGWQRVVWNPPSGYYAGLRYGLECALALLRIAPKGSRDRVDEISYFGNTLREMQVFDKSGKSGAYYAAWKFWDVMLDFTMQPATHANVVRYRTKHLIDLLDEEVSSLRAQLALARKKQACGQRKAVRR